MSIPDPAEIARSARAANTERDQQQRDAQERADRANAEQAENERTVRSYLRSYIGALAQGDVTTYPVYMHERQAEQPTHGYWWRSHPYNKLRAHEFIYHTYTPIGDAYLLEHKQEYDDDFVATHSGKIVTNDLRVFDAHQPLRQPLLEAPGRRRAELTGYFVQYETALAQLAPNIDQLVVDGLAAHMRGEMPLQPINSKYPPIFNFRYSLSTEPAIPLNSAVVDEHVHGFDT
jgi:hypothetical protein